MNVAYRFRCTACQHTWETYTTDRCLYPVENTIEECKCCGCMVLQVSSSYSDDDWREIDFANIKTKRDARTESNLQILIAKIQELQTAGSGEMYEALKAELIEKLKLNYIDLSEVEKVNV